MSRKLEAAAALANMISENWYDVLMPPFSCNEADTIAAFLEAFQGKGAAARFLAGHIEHDSDGDTHYVERTR